MDPDANAPIEPLDSERSRNTPSLATDVGRSILRGVSFGVALALILPATMLVITGLVMNVASPASTPTQLVKALGMTALFGLSLGIALCPLALVEALAARRTGLAAHATASLLTFPLGLLTLAVLALQLSYTISMIETGDPAGAWDDVMSVFDEIARFRAENFLLVCAFLPAVPLTTYFRLRGYTRLGQLGRVVPGTAVAAGALAVAALFAADYVQDSERVILVAMPTALSTILAALLPGAYVRGDQLEAWAVKTFRAWQE